MTGPLQALAQRYDRMAAQGAIQGYGYSMENVSYAVLLSPSGTAIDVMPLLDTSGRQPRPRRLLVPQPFKRTSGIASNFLWDKTSYVLGVSATAKRKAQEHAAFLALHRELLADTEDEGLRALLAFLDAWRPKRFDNPPFNIDMLDANLVFQLDGHREYLHDRSAAKTIWTGRLADADASQAICLVSGAAAPIARLHPSIKGVMGAQSSGASIVSFNQEAFTSYGKEQGANAPVSEAAAFAYGAALNALLVRGSGNSVRIGDTTVAFWAEAPAAEGLARGFLDVDPSDEGEAARVGSILAEMAKGRPIEQAVPDVEPGTAFFVLGLAPNASRLSVRFWLQTTLGDLARRFQEHWADLRLEPSPWQRQPALWRLLLELAPQRKAENIPAQLAGELTRAILTGRPYPRSVLAAVIMRIRADGNVNGHRVALCKACLLRQKRWTSTPLRENDLVSFDPDDRNPGYRLGRLFAQLEGIQLAAHRGLNATIRDRYYGAASATPASVFPLLIRNARNHLATIRKQKGGGLAQWYDQEIGTIIDQLDPSLPRSLSMDDQGRFAIGYYHQRFRDRRTAPPEARAALAEADIALDSDSSDQD
ncbi:type I-C CRISPR-associated protein Cas8c/Csd1 [Marinivivus vitaminiproducens]|uniref:type I-C CRISPR-associated protein Cas8c/Csd1 n=1 Tax=Marinivivus vitaminiproducens TaxID=3035935 RepID=UPI00279CF636|nr:type I-C CRISPR-associated protein Cas8c/Csd1 [Geminicoccaceae bacterium SCSIO 64248]